MKKLKKIPQKKFEFMGTYCPADHTKNGLYPHSGDHSACDMTDFLKKAQKEYENTVEYKQTEILNELIDELNKRDK